VAVPADAPVLTATATGPGGTSPFSACLETGAAGVTALTAPAAAGDGELEVASEDGFVGRVVRIDDGGANEETNFVTGLGASLVLAKPLRFAHAAGAPVVATGDTIFVSVEHALATLIGHGLCFYFRLHGGGGVLATLLDFRRGTWQAVVDHVTLAGLANPVEVSLGIGDDEGLERIFGRVHARLFTYDR
jgi:hypothetical protein